MHFHLFVTPAKGGVSGEVRDLKSVAASRDPSLRWDDGLLGPSKIHARGDRLELADALLEVGELDPGGG